MKNLIVKFLLLTLVLITTGAVITLAFYYFLGFSLFSIHKDLIQLIALSTSLLMILALTKSTPLLWQFYTEKAKIKPNHIYIILAFIGINLCLHYFIKDNSNPVEERGGYRMLQSFLIIPVLEELVFRGVFQAHLTHKYQWNTSVLITSLLFMLIHFGPMDQMVLAFIFSLFVGYLFFRTSSLRLSIIFHIAINIGIYLMGTY